MRNNLIEASSRSDWRDCRSLVVIVVTTLTTQLVGCATSPLQNARMWKIEQCANVPNLNVRFNSADGSTLATIPRASCAAVASAARKIEGVANYQADQIFIADPDSPNAFATENKENRPVIVVTLGMLKALGSDESAWAGLLGHEIAHHVRNHRAGRKEAKEDARATGQVLGNVIAQLIPGMGGFVAGNAASFATANAMYGAYTRPQEREADELGLRWMVAAGYDPRGMERLFNMLAKSGVGLPGFLATHPGDEDRAKMARDYVASTASNTASTTSSASLAGTWKGLSKSTITGAAVNAEMRVDTSGSLAYTSAYGAELTGTLRRANNEIVGTGTMKMPEAFRGQRLPAFPDGTRQATFTFSGNFVSETRIQGTFSGGGDSGTFEFTK